VRTNPKKVLAISYDTGLAKEFLDTWAALFNRELLGLKEEKIAMLETLDNANKRYYDGNLRNKEGKINLFKLHLTDDCKNQLLLNGNGELEIAFHDFLGGNFIRHFAKKVLESQQNALEYKKELASSKENESFTFSDMKKLLVKGNKSEAKVGDQCVKNQTYVFCDVHNVIRPPTVHAVLYFNKDQDESLVQKEKGHAGGRVDFCALPALSPSRAPPPTTPVTLVRVSVASAGGGALVCKKHPLALGPAQDLFDVRYVGEDEEGGGWGESALGMRPSSTTRRRGGSAMCSAVLIRGSVSCSPLDAKICS